jgi:hypothetical protein
MWQLTPSPLIIEIPWNSLNWKKALRKYFSDLESDEELCEASFPFGVILFTPQRGQKVHKKISSLSSYLFIHFVSFHSFIDLFLLLSLTSFILSFLSLFDINRDMLE